MIEVKNLVGLLGKLTRPLSFGLPFISAYITSMEVALASGLAAADISKVLPSLPICKSALEGYISDLIMFRGDFLETISQVVDLQLGEDTGVRSEYRTWTLIEKDRAEKDATETLGKLIGDAEVLLARRVAIEQSLSHIKK